jgi:hypothetical protein
VVINSQSLTRHAARRNMQQQITAVRRGHHGTRAHLRHLPQNVRPSRNLGRIRHRAGASEEAHAQARLHHPRRLPTIRPATSNLHRTLRRFRILSALQFFYRSPPRRRLKIASIPLLARITNRREGCPFCASQQGGRFCRSSRLSRPKSHSKAFDIFTKWHGILVGTFAGKGAVPDSA